MTHPKIIELSKKFNLPVKDFLVRMDGRVEWICEHGVGHTLYSSRGDYLHGCCHNGCCGKLVEHESEVTI